MYIYAVNRSSNQSASKAQRMYLELPNKPNKHFIYSLLLKVTFSRIYHTSLLAQVALRQQAQMLVFSSNFPVPKT